MPLLAEVDTATALWVGLLTLIATKVYDYLVLRETNRKIAAVQGEVKTAATQLNEKADTAATKADTAADQASAAASQATKAMKNTVAVYNLNRKQTDDIKTIVRQTNGASDAKDALIEELRAKLEAVLLLVPPEKVEPVVEALAASKSGTRLNRVPPPSPDPPKES